jgi:hypothetical protein
MRQHGAGTNGICSPIISQIHLPMEQCRLCMEGGPNCVLDEVWEVFSRGLLQQ